MSDDWKSKLLGTWDLVAFENLVDGVVTAPVYGPRPIGRITYNADSTMSAVLGRRDRPWPSGAEFVSVTPEERAAAALEFIGYAGQYSTDGDQVIHHVDVCLYPELEGTDLIRSAQFVEDLLLLSTLPVTTPSGRQRHQRLTWQPHRPLAN